MIVEREKLRHNPEVVAALEAAWKSCCPAGQASISREQYGEMIRKLYLVLKAQAAEGDFDADDCLASADEDWQSDARGKDHLDKDDFFKCWFQLCDLNTAHVAAGEYSQWMGEAVESICAADPSSGSPSKS